MIKDLRQQMKSEINSAKNNVAFWLESLDDETRTIYTESLYTEKLAELMYWNAMRDTFL